MSHHVEYRVEAKPDGFPPLETRPIPEGSGACDAIAVVSIKFLADGGVSYYIGGVDGRTAAALDPSEMFKAWVAMAGSLAADPRLGPGRRTLAAAVVAEVRAALGVPGADSARRIVCPVCGAAPCRC